MADVERISPEVDNLAFMLRVTPDEARVALSRLRLHVITERDREAAKARYAELEADTARAWAEVSRVQQVGLRAESELAQLRERARAEQVVLDACGGLKITVNEFGPASRLGKPVIVSVTSDVADAELARREAKR